TRCVGHFDEPQCQEVCPVDCIIPDPDRPETRGQLEAKYRQLMAGS
ncbi:MAG: ferredoxin, partial [Gammaproteobacteria bacterium]